MLSAAIMDPRIGDAMPPRAPAEVAHRDGGILDDDQRDLALLERLRASDPAALDALLHRYWRPLVSYAARLLPEGEDAEDVAQEALIRIWERRLFLESTTALRPLLYRIARNIALNRKRGWRTRNGWHARLSVTRRPQSTTPLQETLEHELQQAIDDAIRALPPRRRDAFILARFHDMSYSQIALVMGISAQTVANQISSALSELRRALAPFLESRTLE